MSADAVDAIQLTADDNVATVLRAVAAGEAIRIRQAGAVTILTAREAIAMCHKICVAPIGPGQPVRKYRHSIGDATASVAAGRHAHVHNLRSARAKAAP
jgi:hypothetical protein